MDNGNSKDGKDNQQIIIQSSNYNVTVIPVEFPVRNRIYTAQDNEYITDQYGYCQESIKNYSGLQTQWSNEKGSAASDNKKDPMGFDDYNDNPLPPRIASVSTSYSNDSAYCQERKTYSSIQPQWGNGGDGKKDHAIYEEVNDNQNHLIKASVASNPATVASAQNPVINEPFDEPVIPMCVYLHNKTVIMMEIEDTPCATCEMICQAIINCEELALNKPLAAQVFTLWMISPILEIQLKPYSKPYEIRQNWRNLIEKYGHASESRKEKDEPKLVFQRNIFVAKQLEEKIKSREKTKDI